MSVPSSDLIPRRMANPFDLNPGRTRAFMPSSTVRGPPDQAQREEREREEERRDIASRLATLLARQMFLSGDSLEFGGIREQIEALENRQNRLNTGFNPGGSFLGSGSDFTVLRDDTFLSSRGNERERGATLRNTQLSEQLIFDVNRRVAGTAFRGLSRLDDAMGDREARALRRADLAEQRRDNALERTEQATIDSNERLLSAAMQNLMDARERRAGVQALNARLANARFASAPRITPGMMIQPPINMNMMPTRSTMPPDDDDDN